MDQTRLLADEITRSRVRRNSRRHESPRHSETSGPMLARLSVLASKQYLLPVEATRESATAEPRRKCSRKCALLEEQLHDPKKCLQELLAQLQAGVRRLKIHRQLKMYNDASFNPELYGGGRARTL